MNPPRLGCAVVGAALVLALASCNRGQREVHAASAASVPPPITTAVGPIPGPEQNPSRPANPFAADAAAMADGRALFVRMNCSGCHGGRAGGGMGPSLRDEDWLYGNTDAQIFSTIAEGRAHGMPSWGSKLTTEQVWKLVTYIKSLRTASEPQRPG
jgi:cytochrome c oxidase cbb3-type subunit 3